MDRHVLRKSLAETTLELCSISSVTGNEAALTDALEIVCAKMGEHVRWKRDGNSLMVYGAWEEGRPTIALLGHTDTVPETIGQQYCYDESSGKVFGLGASDMKGGLAVMLALLQKAHLGFSVNLRCVFYDREEGPVTESGLEPLLQAGALEGTDLALCLEPTDAELQCGCVGSIQAYVIFEGKRAHSARPWHGKNAVYEGIPFLSRLAAFGKREVVVAGLPFYEVMSVTGIDAGDAPNVIPDRMRVRVNYRFAPGKSVEQAVAELCEVAGPSVEVNIHGIAGSAPVYVGHPLLQEWITRRGLLVTPKQAWTDVARLSAYGIPAVNFGPGQTAQAHQANEWIWADSLLRAYEVLKDLLGGGSLIGESA